MLSVPPLRCRTQRSNETDDKQDFEQVEEWNEFGELKQAIGPVPAAANTSTKASTTAPSSANAQKGETTSSSNAAPPASDPMRDLATQAASVGLGRAKGPHALVDGSKIRPLPGAAQLQSKEPKQSESAPSTEPSATEKTTSDQTGKTKPPEVEAVEKYIARDPTDPVPSAGTPLSSVHPGRTPNESEPVSTVDSSDSLAGGQGGIVEPSKETAALESTSSLHRETSSASSTSQPAGSKSLSHRGSEIKLASPDEIKEVEDVQKIPEVTDESEDDQAGEKAADASKAGDSVQD